MGDVSGLPALSDPRLIILQKQTRRVRKGITIRNDKLKAHKEKNEKVLDKTKASVGYRAWQNTMPYKNSLAEIRGLQKCLKKRRESSTLDPEMTPRNGVYEGASLDSMKRQVDDIIRTKNPRARRIRKVERIKNTGLQDGKIVDYNSSMNKFSEVLNRPRGIFRGERPMSALDLLEGQGSSSTSSPYCITPDSPAQFRLPPIQARRSTLANTSLLSNPKTRFYDAKSDRSEPMPSMKRSMSFAVAR